MSQHGGQTRATFCAQQCCDMLRWHVAIAWPGLKTFFGDVFVSVVVVVSLYKYSRALSSLSWRKTHR